MKSELGLNNRKKKNYLGKIIAIAAWTSLLAAFIYGKFIQHDDYTARIEANNLEIVDNNPDFLSVLSSNDTIPSRIRFGTAQGYGGELAVGVKYDTTGTIEQVYVLRERETFSFLAKLNNKRFFDQFCGKKINDALVVESDIDAISGCTVSSVGFTNAIREASYNAAVNDFNLAVTEPVVSWQFGLSEVAVLLLIVTGILALYLKKKWIRYIAMAISVVLIGFHLNASLSISHFARLALGFLPNLHDHFVWWILVAVSLVFPFFLKKNLYCFALCPFHAVQTGLIKISGFQLQLTRSFQKVSKVVSLSLLWIAFMLIFISENPTLGSYEPFALLFSLDGVGLQWYLLPAALIGALLVPDFYCRYFCPVGRSLKLVMKAGIRMRAFIFNEKAAVKPVKETRHIRKTAKKAS